MPDPISERALERLFLEARTRDSFAPAEVSESLIRQVYDLAKMGPTSANCSPARFYFIAGTEAKERLRPHLTPGNVDKTMAAPWTAIIAMDMAFYEKIPQLFPHNPGARDWFTASPEVTLDHAMRNGTLQGAYLMLAARAVGLDCGPMSGFDRAGVDAAFFEGTQTMASWKSNWLCNLGFADDAPVYPRLPRLSFEEACVLA